MKKENWWRCSIFHTRVYCGGKVCDVIIDNGSEENCVLIEAAEKNCAIKNVLPRIRLLGLKVVMKFPAKRAAWFNMTWLMLIMMRFSGISYLWMHAITCCGGEFCLIDRYIRMFVKTLVPLKMFRCLSIRRLLRTF